MVSRGPAGRPHTLTCLPWTAPRCARGNRRRTAPSGGAKESRVRVLRRAAPVDKSRSANADHDERMEGEAVAIVHIQCSLFVPSSWRCRSPASRRLISRFVRFAQIVLKNPKSALATNSRICAATLSINADCALKAHRRVTEGEGRLSAGSSSNFRRSLCSATGIVIGRKIRVFQHNPQTAVIHGPRGERVKSDP